MVRGPKAIAPGAPKFRPRWSLCGAALPFPSCMNHYSHPVNRALQRCRVALGCWDLVSRQGVTAAYMRNGTVLLRDKCEHIASYAASVLVYVRSKTHGCRQGRQEACETRPSHSTDTVPGPLVLTLSSRCACFTMSRGEHALKPEADNTVLDIRRCALHIPTLLVKLN